MADEDDVVTAEDERAVAALRALAQGEPAAEAPSPALWDRIAAEAFDEGAGDGARGEASDGPGPGAPVPAGAASDVAPVVPLARRTRRAPWPALAAAAAAAVVLVVGGLWLVTGGDEATQVAAGELVRLDDDEAPAATAEVVEVDGQPQLRFTPPDLPETDGFYEVWIGTPELDGLISLGPLRASGTYDLPPGVDVGAFPVVDVSEEPFDGDPTHSAVSVLRGQLA